MSRLRMAAWGAVALGAAALVPVVPGVALHGLETWLGFGIYSPDADGDPVLWRVHAAASSWGLVGALLLAAGAAAFLVAHREAGRFQAVVLVPLGAGVAVLATCLFTLSPADPGEWTFYTPYAVPPREPELRWMAVALGLAAGALWAAALGSHLGRRSSAGRFETGSFPRRQPG